MANERYNFKFLPLVGKLPGKSMVEQTETAINELASVVYDNVGYVGNFAEEVQTEVQTANTNASNALDKATEALETSGRVYIKLIAAVDVNDYYDSELYYINNDVSTNIPVRDRGFLEVKTNDDKTACEQVFIDDSTGTPYYRHGRITEQTLGEETTYVVTWGSWYQGATTEYVQAELQDYLPLSGGTLTGVVNGVTPTAGDNSAKIATTEFVNAKAGNYLPLSGGTVTGDLDVTSDITCNSVTSHRVNVRSGRFAPVNTLQRSTAYSVDDIVYTSALNAKYYLLCVTAGTTSATMPSFRGAGSNTEVTDGTVVWRVQTITSQESQYGFLKRNTAYKVGNIAYTTQLPAGYYLECVTAGTTGNTEPTISVGSENVKDGTVKWGVKNIQNEINTGVPVGVVHAYAGNTVPQGWLVCDGSSVSRTDYADLFSAIGTTYGSGNGSTTFNLPNLVDKFVEGSATAGTVKSAGLPDITGVLSLHGGEQASIINRAAATNNALYGSGGSETQYRTGADLRVKNNAGSYGNINFSASRSSSIYGKSTTVQPPALTMRYIIKY